MSVHKKLMQARIALQAKELKKTGHNKFAGFYYFELGDFLPTVQQIFNELGLCGTVSFGEDATLTIRDTEDDSSIIFHSPMSTCELKGCHAIQNLGAVETYTRRYLWVTALEIVEHDVLDATVGQDEVKPKVKSVEMPKEKVLETPNDPNPNLPGKPEPLADKGKQEYIRIRLANLKETKAIDVFDEAIGSNTNAPYPKDWLDLLNLNGLTESQFVALKAALKGKK